MNDSDEDDIILAKAIKQHNEKRARKIRVSNGRSSESMYRDEKDNLSKNEDHHENQTRFHGMVERENKLGLSWAKLSLSWGLG